MKLNFTQKISAIGYFSVNVLDSNGNDTGKGIQDVNNVVTNYGKILPRHTEYRPSSLTLLEGTFDFAAGTGVNERTVSSTQLGSEIAVARGSVSSGSGTGYTDNGDGTETYKRVCKGSYPLGALDHTISEVGIFHDGTLVAGQLIKDGNGNPTTVTVLPDEQLVVNYTIEWTYTKDVISETTGTIDVNGTSTTWTLQVPPVKAGGLFQYPSKALKTYMGYNFESALVAADETFIVTKPITTNNMTYVDNITEITLGEAFAPSEGAGDVAAIILGTDEVQKSVLDKHCVCRINFSPAIPKTDAEVLEIEVSWKLTGT